MLSTVILVIVLPKITSIDNEKCAWIKELGHFIIDKIILKIGDEHIDTITGEWLHIFYNLELA